jgi:hypothetical protein
MKDQMCDLSRRSIVTGAAALPALAVPVVASNADADDDRLVAAFAEAQQTRDGIDEGL